MLARPTEMSRVLDLCETALLIVDYFNPDRLTSGIQPDGTFIAHCHEVKIVLCMPRVSNGMRILDVWHNGIVLSVEWDFRGARIHKFKSGKWEGVLHQNADLMRPVLEQSRREYARLQQEIVEQDMQSRDRREAHDFDLRKTA